jgi:hypothetical protein
MSIPAEARTPRSIDRGGKRDRLNRNLAKVVECRIDDLALAADTVELCLVRSYVTLVLHRQPLLGIGVLNYGDSHLNSVHINVCRARISVERNAHNGLPAVGILHDENMLVAKTDVGYRQPGRADVDNRYAAGSC